MLMKPGNFEARAINKGHLAEKGLKFWSYEWEVGPFRAGMNVFADAQYNEPYRYEHYVQMDRLIMAETICLPDRTVRHLWMRDAPDEATVIKLRLYV